MKQLFVDKCLQLSKRVSLLQTKHWHAFVRLFNSFCLCGQLAAYKLSLSCPFFAFNRHILCNFVSFISARNFRQWFVENWKITLDINSVTDGNSGGKTLQLITWLRPVEEYSKKCHKIIFAFAVAFVQAEGQLLCQSFNYWDRFCLFCWLSAITTEELSSTPAENVQMAFNFWRSEHQTLLLFSLCSL